jgi:serine/threonine protein kinase/WD40 repeat protein
MSDAASDRDPFEVVAESFLASYRAGERPSIEELAARHPELAGQIRKLLPAMVRVEQDLTIDPEPSAKGVPLAPPNLARQLADYRIVREIGRGGMGVVYEAEQISLGRRVALKVLPAHAVGDRKALERFRREAKAAARLHHTNIVPVFEVGREGDLAFYAMQLILGQGLEQVIDELRRLHEPGWKPNAQGPVGPEGPEAPDTVTRDRGAATRSAHHQRELGRMAELLLSGCLVTDGLRSRASDTATSAGLDETARFESEETEGREPGDTRGDRAQPARPAPDLSSSAVLPGGTHVSEVDTSGRRQPYFRSVAQIGRQAAQALAYAHARGIVHRDIKPSNLLLDTAGVVWITDFGLAKAEEDGLTQTGDILGTLRYMAPERFRGEGDARADIYALGMTLYELLTLRPAYESSDRLKLIEQIKAEEPARPRSLDGRIPRDLETIVLKASDKAPERRYPTAEAMAENLRRFLADEPIKARQISTSERYWRWARRNPVIAVLGGVVTALLVAMTVGSTIAATYFQGLADREARANQQAQEAQRRAFAERDHSRRLSADLALDKGVALAETGHADRGLLWMLEALETAPENADAFKKMIRLNLGAWLGQVHKPLRFIDTGSLANLCSLSPDGKLFATGTGIAFTSNASSWIPISIWDTASGRKLSTLSGAFAPFAFRPDGKVLIAHADQSRMVAIELDTMRLLWSTPPLRGQWAGRINFDADASMISARRYDGLENDVDSRSVWLLRLNAGTGKECAEPLRGSGDFAVAPDGKLAATGRTERGEMSIDLLDLPSGRRTASFPVGARGLNSLEFSPDGKSLYGSVRKSIAAKASNFVARIWAVDSQNVASPLLADTGVGVYTPSADRLVTASEDLLLVREVTGRARGTSVPLSGGTGGGLLFAPCLDGRTMLALDSDLNVALWQISMEAELVPEKAAILTGNTPVTPFRGDNVRDSVWVIALCANAQIAVSPSRDAAGQEQVRLFDPATGRPFGAPAPHHPGWRVRSFAVSPDGRYFATGSEPGPTAATGELRLWDTSTGRLLFPPIPFTNYVSAIAFHPDGKLLATGDYSGLVRTWDLATGQEIGRPLPQGGIVTALSFSSDGRVLAVGLARDNIPKPGTRLWDVTTRQLIGDLLPSIDSVQRIEFQPDGRALLASTHQSVQLWDTTQGRALAEPLIDEGIGAFRPDGHAFLTVGKDGSIKLRDATTGEVVGRFLTSSSPANCAVFRGDGGLIAAGFEDGAVRLYDPATNQPVGPPRFLNHAVVRVAFTTDGRSVAAIDDLGDARTWPVPEPLDGDLSDLTLRIEARTGLRMETGLAIARLNSPAWQERLEQLARLDPNAARPDTDPAWHAPMIREAEQNGNTFAAIWHLDRLIAARPNDWFLYARRGRARSLSDDFDKAAADFQKAVGLSSQDQVLDFQCHCVLDCTKAERWAAALWYLDCLISARPKDGSLHLERAAVYGKLGREVDRQAELARVFELGADEGVVIPRAEELGRAGRWAEAAGLLGRCGRKGPVSRELAQAWAIACLEAGDRAGYREACAAFLAGQGPVPTVVWNALFAASLLALAPEAADDYRAPIAYFEKRLSADPAPPPLYRRLFSNALGGLLLRAGRVEEAIARVDEGIAAMKDFQVPNDWAYLAMAHARKGSFDEAGRALERLRDSPAGSSATFWDLRELALLRGEAESLLLDAGFPSDPLQGPRPRP